MGLLDSITAVILANELANNRRAIYRFSDPDGILSGKSGWSFGICQFDINNNPLAIDCLRQCLFTTDEIAGLKAQSIPDMHVMNGKLVASGPIVDHFDARQLEECLCRPSALCREARVQLTDEGLIALADYHNQFYMSRGGKMHRHVQTIGRPVTAEDIRDFKLTLPWGKKRPDDVQRRHANIIKVMQ